MCEPSMSSQSTDHNKRNIVECITDYIVIYVPCIALTQYNKTIYYISYLSSNTLSSLSTSPGCL